MSTEVEENLEEEIKPHRSPVLAGLLGEFTDVDGVLHAAAHLRDAGFHRWDVHTPFPVHGMDAAMGIRPTILPWLCLGAGFTGTVTAFALEWYANVFDYPLYTSGKPLLSVPAWIPVAFEMTVLFAALTAVFGMLGLNRLPRLYNPLFNNRRFRRVTDDRFFVVIDASDPKFNREEMEDQLFRLGAVAVEWVTE